MSDQKCTVHCKVYSAQKVHLYSMHYAMHTTDIVVAFAIYNVFIAKLKKIYIFLVCMGPENYKCVCLAAVDASTGNFVRLPNISQLHFLVTTQDSVSFRLLSNISVADPDNFASGPV